MISVILICILYFFFQYENDIITIDLMQNSSEKTQNDVDIADVAYYFEKDVSLIFLILTPVFRNLMLSIMPQ